jgi:hypothetical protein
LSGKAFDGVALNACPSRMAANDKSAALNLHNYTRLRPSKISLERNPSGNKAQLFFLFGPCLPARNHIFTFKMQMRVIAQPFSAKDIFQATSFLG